MPEIYFPDFWISYQDNLVRRVHVDYSLDQTYAFQYWNGGQWKNDEGPGKGPRVACGDPSQPKRDAEVRKWGLGHPWRVLVTIGLGFSDTSRVRWNPDECVWESYHSAGRWVHTTHPTHHERVPEGGGWETEDEKGVKETTEESTWTMIREDT